MCAFTVTKRTAARAQRDVQLVWCLENVSYKTKQGKGAGSKFVYPLDSYLICICKNSCWRNCSALLLQAAGVCSRVCVQRGNRLESSRRLRSLTLLKSRPDNPLVRGQLHRAAKTQRLIKEPMTLGCRSWKRNTVASDTLNEIIFPRLTPLYVAVTGTTIGSADKGLKNNDFSVTHQFYLTLLLLSLNYLRCRHA